MKLGQRVYVKELEQYGYVKSFDHRGNIDKIEIQTPTGVEIIEAVRFTIILLNLVEQLIDALQPVFNKIRNAFRRKR